MPNKPENITSSAPPIMVSFEQEGREETLTFSDAFIVGRGRGEDVYLVHKKVSRKHLFVWFEKGEWWIEDLKSTNGSFVGGQKITRMKVGTNLKVRLASKGPLLSFSFHPTAATPEEEAPAEKSKISPEEFRKRMLADLNDSKVSERTRLLRKLIAEERQRHRRRLIQVSGAFTAIVIILLGYVVYQEYVLNQLIAAAQEKFYDMKAREVQIAALEQRLSQTPNREQQESIDSLSQENQQDAASYENFLDKLDLYRSYSEEEKLILKVARIFGECELAIPPSFMQEVKVYIDKWRKDNRLRNAISRARARQYHRTIVERMREQHLAPQFFYLALQESNFNERAVGPQTRYGYAKGIWQFIPRTARRYNLRVGPLSQSSEYDPKDERFDFQKATQAAARYLKDIYTTRAQASGLLVIASYNWGEHRIDPLLEQMPIPKNPREGNFWHLLTVAKIPMETYNYVLMIFSAAVIGENPRLFGFDFENPLGSFLEESTMHDIVQRDKNERRKNGGRQNFTWYYHSDWHFPQYVNLRSKEGSKENFSGIPKARKSI